MDLLSELLKDAQVEVTFAGMPPVTVALDSKQPNALVAALRPRIVVKKSGVTLTTIQPYGNPDTGAPWVPIVLGASVVALGVLVFFAVR